MGSPVRAAAKAADAAQAARAKKLAAMAADPPVSPLPQTPALTAWDQKYAAWKAAHADAGGQVPYGSPPPPPMPAEMVQALADKFPLLEDSGVPTGSITPSLLSKKNKPAMPAGAVPPLKPKKPKPPKIKTPVTYSPDGKTMIDSNGNEWIVPELGDEPDFVDDAGVQQGMPEWTYNANEHTLRKQAELESARKPGENVRDYIARLRELQKTRHGVPAVVSAVTQLERDLANDLSGGLFGGTYFNPNARERFWQALRSKDQAEYEDAILRAARQLDEPKGKKDLQRWAVGHPNPAETAARFRAVEKIANGALPDSFFDTDGRMPARRQDYLDYLSANGVDQRTIDDVASGALPMDSESRAARAREMGLDPDSVWYRWDSPLKTQFKGYTGAALSQPEFARSKKKALKFIDLSPSKEGLVYTSYDPEWAEQGVQIPKNQITLYGLIGPNDGIVGLDRIPQSAYDTFEAKQKQALSKTRPRSTLPSWMESFKDTPEGQRIYRRNHPMGEHVVENGNLEDWHNWREHGMRQLREVKPDTPTSRRYSTLPDYSTAETRKEYLEPLMATGAKGTLVRDETGLSTAFTPAGASQLRRADLAPLDTRFKLSRNLLQSLLAPVAVGGAAAAAGSQQPPMLNGLRAGENR
jgi:hypothetical protein